MLRPSYSELMEKLNNDKKVDSQITSRYTIVLAAAKRARQIIDGANPLTYAPADKAVSIAIKELSEGRLLIKADPDSLEGAAERTAPMYYQGISSVSKDDLREDFKDKYASAETGEEDDDDSDDGYEDDDYKEEGYKEGFEDENGLLEDADDDDDLGNYADDDFDE